MTPRGEVLCVYNLLETSAVEASTHVAKIFCWVSAGRCRRDGVSLEVFFIQESWEPQANRTGSRIVCNCCARQMPQLVASGMASAPLDKNVGTSCQVPSCWRLLRDHGANACSWPWCDRAMFAFAKFSSCLRRVAGCLPRCLSPLGNHGFGLSQTQQGVDKAS